MTLPAAGIITAAMINQELGRAAGAAFSLNDPAVRALAGKPSGAISFLDLRGKSSEIVVNVTSSPATANNTDRNLQNYFTTADWTSETNKRLVIASGVDLVSVMLYTALTTAWGGVLTIENNGTISGGWPNNSGGGVGAAGQPGVYAMFINMGSSATLKLVNNGVIRGSGGGGGAGGTGGGGSTTSNVNQREPASGHLYDANYSWRTYTIYGSLYGGPITWGGVQVASMQTGAETSIAADDGFTYYRGPYKGSGDVGDGMTTQNSYGVYRQGVVSSTVNTAGGAGGAGGDGASWLGARANGVNGSAGGTNAGAGGKGGNGGDWGQPGGQGAKGVNGNRTNGIAGFAGGGAGQSINGYSRVDYSGSGTLIGPTIN